MLQGNIHQSHLQQITGVTLVTAQMLKLNILKGKKIKTFGFYHEFFFYYFTCLMPSALQQRIAPSLPNYRRLFKKKQKNM